MRINGWSSDLVHPGRSVGSIWDQSGAPNRHCLVSNAIPFGKNSCWNCWRCSSDACRRGVSDRDCGRAYLI